jgi:hypothetical protein
MFYFHRDRPPKINFDKAPNLFFYRVSTEPSQSKIVILENNKVTKIIKRYSSIGSPNNQIPRICGFLKYQIFSLTEITSQGIENIKDPIVARKNTFLYFVKSLNFQIHKIINGKITKISNQIRYSYIIIS